ncbi:hypothetical protein ACTD5D_34445 [Nocardia takedensis]|uniref:hypothetical protein n=1 Tax=Nocardia takedensis TaxID=259390 RepID=UPI0002EEC5B0|nr:hypothetical protein [Nocardia takedensis]
MGFDTVAEYSREPVTEEHLRRLAEIARNEVEMFFGRNPHLAPYRDAYLMTALTQGAALHYASGGQHRVKDLDIHAFFVKVDPHKTQLRRARRVIDFGLSEFGRHPDDVALGFAGRHVDGIFRLVDTAGSADDPIATVRGYLRHSSTPTAFHLRQKAVVALDPPELFGEVVWFDRSARLDPGYDE